MLPYALTIFTGAFLLFQVQPLIGKYILPWFGGSPGVWTTCMLFFQTLLLAGYAYAHVSTTRLTPKRQAVVHLVLLALALACLPITPGDAWKPTTAGDPTGRILLLLMVSLGLPYFVLSATGPLLQRWFSQAHPGKSPYRLYALSNIGSLLALISYPFFFEPVFSRQTQATLWSFGLGFFVLVCGYCALRLRRLPADPFSPTAGSADFSPVPAPSKSDQALWVILPALASIILLATTNKLCQDVAVIPFLWVLPLSLYLLSFIICFDHARWYHRGIFAALLVTGTIVVCDLLFSGHSAPLSEQIIGYAGLLFVACMVCHGELYRLKPAPQHLTSYYLLIAVGGALGGFLVAVVAPLVFSLYLELQIGVWVLFYLVGVLAFKDRSRALVWGTGAGVLLAALLLPVLRISFPADFSTIVRRLGEEAKIFYGDYWKQLAAVALLFAVCAVDYRRGIVREWRGRLGAFIMVLTVLLGVTFMVQIKRSVRSATAFSRNFYGALQVTEYNHTDEWTHHYLLVHGVTTHGMQFTDPLQARWTTTYYGETSGVGLALKHLNRPAGKRIGLVGLGVGTVAAYGQPEDYLRIYEINPEIERLARTYFTYLENCESEVDVVMGDARLSMENELKAGEPQRFDLLVLDAFSSDAIPVHLLTREAFATYLEHLAPDGVIAVHISNRYLNLRPVVDALGEHFDLSAATISDDNDEHWWIYGTTWVLMTKNAAWLETEEILDAAEVGRYPYDPVPLWTDDHASLLKILR